MVLTLLLLQLHIGRLIHWFINHVLVLAQFLTCFSHQFYAGLMFKEIKVFKNQEFFDSLEPKWRNKHKKQNWEIIDQIVV